MNSPPSSSAAPAEKLLSSDGEAETGNLVEKRISKPLTHIEVEAERITSSVVRLTSNSIDGLEGLSSELRQLQTFLKSEVERVPSEIRKRIGWHQDHNREYCSLGARGSCGSNIESQFRR